MKTIRVRYFFIFALVCAFITSAFLFHPAHSGGDNADGKFWVERCSKPEGAKKERCEIFQRISLKDSGQRVLEFAIAMSEEKGKYAQGVVILPLGIKVQQGVRMQIDENDPYRFNVHHCEANGCVGFVDMDKKLLNKMKKGEIITLGMFAASGKPLNIKMSLSGFSKALKKI